MNESMVMDLERSLSEPPFMGVPIGPTLASLATLDFLTNQVPLNLRYALLHQIKRAWHTLRPLQARGSDPDIPSGRVLVMAASSSPRYRDLALPVARALGAKRCMVLCLHEETRALVPDPIVTVGLREALHYNVSSWRREFDTSWPSWRRALRDWMTRAGLPAAAWPRLADAVMTGSQLIAGFAGFLRAAGIRAVVVEHDRMQTSACLVLAAQSCGVASFTLVHGVMNQGAFGFVPVLADHVLAWGGIDRQILIDAGTPPDRITITGCPRLSRSLDADREASRRKTGLPPDGRLVLLATANFRADQRGVLARTFCEAATGSGGFAAAVRLHPSERMADYRELAAAFPAVRFVDNATWSLDEALAAADVVVVHNSGFGSDALMKKRPVVVLDCLDLPLGHGQLLAERANCPVARDAAALRAVIARLENDAAFRDDCQARGDAFSKEFVAFTGDEAAVRIATAILAGRE